MPKVTLTRAQQDTVSQLLATSGCGRAQAWAASTDTASADALSPAAARLHAIAGNASTRNEQMQQRGRQLRAAFEAQQQTPAWLKMQPARQKLPALAAREALLQTIASSDVTVVAGGTGCGKSTQVPQFLLNEMLQSGQGGRCNIICTQPRRIAAVGVAERVAEERGEPIGRSVGYTIRGESKRSADSRLVFCTTGFLLKMLEEDHKLASVTHVVIDEVHERSCDSDLLLLMCRTFTRNLPAGAILRRLIDLL
jgi:HrpA-like RNA helicase